MVGLGLVLGVGLGASELFIVDCLYAILGDRVPVAGTGYTTLYLKNPHENSACKFHMCWRAIKNKALQPARTYIVGTIGYNVGSY